MFKKIISLLALTMIIGAPQLQAGALETLKSRAGQKAEIIKKHGKKILAGAGLAMLAIAGYTFRQEIGRGFVLGFFAKNMLPNLSVTEKLMCVVGGAVAVATVPLLPKPLRKAYNQTSHEVEQNIEEKQKELGQKAI